jgi:hypothetical protein
VISVERQHMRMGMLLPIRLADQTESGGTAETSLSVRISTAGLARKPDVEYRDEPTGPAGSAGLLHESLRNKPSVLSVTVIRRGGSPPSFSAPQSPEPKYSRVNRYCNQYPDRYSLADTLCKRPL